MASLLAVRLEVYRVVDPDELILLYIGEKHSSCYAEGVGATSTICFSLQRAHLGM